MMVGLAFHGGLGGCLRLKLAMKEGGSAAPVPPWSLEGGGEDDGAIMRTT